MQAVDVYSQEPSSDLLLSPPPRRPSQSGCQGNKTVSCQGHEMGVGVDSAAAGVPCCLGSVLLHSQGFLASDSLGGWQVTRAC